MSAINIKKTLDLKHHEKCVKIDYSTRFSNESEYLNLIIDCLGEVDCIFIRTNRTEIDFDETYKFEKTPNGGYIATPHNPSQYYFWIPSLSTARSINAASQILNEVDATVSSITWNEDKVSVKIGNSSINLIDLIIWRFKQDFLNTQLLDVDPVELLPYFLWGSHSTVNKPSDLYNHLIFGSVYDRRYSWPQNKRCFSENEAHALYTVYAGLENQTGKIIYRHFQQQLVLSVIHRQSEDGGWYHGMWTDASECHYRLHTSGVHLLLDEFEKTQCPTVKVALEKAVHFLSKQTDNLDCGVWFLHDSLELSEQAMNAGPFRWIPNRTLGKSVSNMLVLNTHLDATIAINRYAKLTGDRQYDELVQSALQSTRTVLSMQPADWLYKPLFWAIGLTMLPTDVASQLPLPIRAIKRIAANYLIKKLPDIKARFPRLVMPNGYIDRELSLRTWAIDYQTINLMDLARHAYAFPGQFDEAILDNAIEFAQKSGLIKRYQDLSIDKRYAPGFWAEALYYRCLTKPDFCYRQWLAEAIIWNHNANIGISPSLLGANREALNHKNQNPLITINDSRIFVVDLSIKNKSEIIMINLSAENITINTQNNSINDFAWKTSKGECIETSDIITQRNEWITGKLKINP